VLVGLSALPRSAAEREVLGLILDEIVGVAIGIVPVARPIVVLRRANHPSSNRIEVPIAHDGEDVAAVRAWLNHWRLHALGDDLAAPGFLLAVVPAREEVVDDLPEAAECGLTFGSDDDEVRVGAHQAIGTDLNAVAAGVLLDEVEKEPLGSIELEDMGRVVTAPGAVVGRAELDEEATRNAGHRWGRGKRCAARAAS